MKGSTANNPTIQTARQTQVEEIPDQLHWVNSRPSAAFTRLFHQLPMGGSLSDNKLHRMQVFHEAEEEEVEEQQQQQQLSKKQQLLLQSQNQKYIKPREYLHKENVDCMYDLVCIQGECRILQKLCCSECAGIIHPNHSLESLDWFFNYEREKIKRKDGIHKTHLHELHQVISLGRKRRMKYWKWCVRVFKRIEKECRMVETFAQQKINGALNFKSRQDAVMRLIGLVRRSGHHKLDSLMKTNPEYFEVKQEIGGQVNRQSSPGRLKEDKKQIVDIVDRLFLADEREKERYHSQRSSSPSPGMASKHLRVLSDRWEKMMHKTMGCVKRFSKHMFSETRMSVQSGGQIKLQVIEVNLSVDGSSSAPIKSILQLSSSQLITVHQNELKIWNYNNKQFNEFKAITGLQLQELRHVAVAEKRGEFILLHGVQETWAISQRNTETVSRLYLCPIRDLKISRLAVTSCESMLFASGGCRTSGFYIVCWSYQDARVLRVIRRKFSFPHEGDLLINNLEQHIFRCNKNSVDVFKLLSGEHLQTLVLKRAKFSIEHATILKTFQNKDCLCVSTNNGTIHVYQYDNTSKYKIIYELDQNAPRSLYNVFYQNDLAEDGLFLAINENNESRVVFQDFNKKMLLKDINFKDTILCGQLQYTRSPWRNQLSIILGFQSGLIRIINLLKLS